MVLPRPEMLVVRRVHSRRAGSDRHLARSWRRHVDLSELQNLRAAEVGRDPLSSSRHRLRPSASRATVQSRGYGVKLTIQKSMEHTSSDGTNPGGRQMRASTGNGAALLRIGTGLPDPPETISA